MAIFTSLFRFLMNLNLAAKHSPLTQSVPRFPQEIIDKIIDELSSDENTLKQCSTVSRSFHMSSRRHLFFIIHLNTVKKIVLFHRLLIRTPEIGQNVRKFRLQLGKQWKDSPEGKIIDIGKCFATTNLLVDTFSLLPCIESFCWFDSASWDELPSNFRLALVTLFQLPSLTTIDISGVTDFPLSVLHVVSPVKRLILQSVLLHSSDQSPVILPHLEVLRINSEIWQPNDVELLLPNLHQLSIWDERNGQGVPFAQQAINGSTRSLQRIWWHYDLQRPHPVSLSKLCCLQFLTLVIVPRYGVGTRFAGWGRNIHFTALALLKDSSIKQTLKDLTIGVLLSRKNYIDSDWLDLSGDKIWKDLDLILASISSLQRTLIHLYHPSGTWEPDLHEVPTGIRSSMPLIEQRGMLFFKMKSDVLPERDMWTDRGY